MENRTFFAGTEVSALTTSVKLAAGQGVLRKGAVLGKVTADKTYKLVNASATDGCQVASMILAIESIDTNEAGADLDVVAYKRGIFNYNALYVANGDKVEAHQDELRAVSIYYKTDYPATVN
ncbi:hypothetical protein ET33_26445 [Paenibacillus tyrfis]|uniref:Head decoration protein n=1 Tax=Paenibacillus tyrfis TaxID=1501230 RepID=A0A081NV40_9BACL|nr:hypothetical protein ET33_26445 [Paenibacillus tyrfis]